MDRYGNKSTYRFGLKKTNSDGLDVSAVCLPWVSAVVAIRFPFTWKHWVLEPVSTVLAMKIPFAEAIVLGKVIFPVAITATEAFPDGAKLPVMLKFTSPTTTSINFFPSNCALFASVIFKVPVKIEIPFWMLSIVTISEYSLRDFTWERMSLGVRK